MSMIRITVAGFTVAVGLFIPAAVAQAGSSGPPPAHAHQEASKTLTVTAGSLGGISAQPSSAAPLNAPAGCPSGDVCFYYQGGGGGLCGYTDADSYNLGSGGGGLAPYGNNCANIGPQSHGGISGSIYNNGKSCTGCQDVKLYYDKGYQGAWYCLPKGHYLLYIQNNYFYGGGANADGQGEQLAYNPNSNTSPGGVASAKWTSC